MKYETFVVVPNAHIVSCPEESEFYYARIADKARNRP